MTSLRTTETEARRALWIAAASVGLTAAVTYLPLPVHSPAPKVFASLKETLLYGARWADYLAQTGDFRSLTGAAWYPLAHVAGMAAGTAISTAAGLVALFKGVKPHEYGEGEFAGIGRIKKMGLDGKLGPILGSFAGKELRSNEPRHSMIVAPTRSGKTAGVIIPSLLTYPGTVVVIDPKLELSAKTAKARAKMGPVYQIDWSNPESPHSWSPVAFNALPKNPLEIERLAERIAAMFFPPATGADKYWTDTARRNLAALLMFEIYQAKDTGREPHIGQITSTLASFEANKKEEPRPPAPSAEEIEAANQQDDKKRKFAESLVKKIQAELASGKRQKKSDAIDDIIAAWNDFKDGSTDGKPPPKRNDPVGDHLLRLAAIADLNGYPKRVKEDLMMFANLDQKERSAHLNTLLTGIQLMRLEAVQESTRTASFSFKELQDQPCTIYIRFPQQDAKAFGPLTALFFESLFAYVLDNPKGENQVPIWIAADEFASLPKIPLLLDFMAKAAGNGSHISIVVQDFAQIEETYGKTGLSTILTNCTHTIAFQQNNAQTADMLTKLVGKKTRFKKTKSGTWLKPFAPSVTEATEGVPVITPEDWGRIPFGKQIVLVQGHLIYPILADSPMWYESRKYKKLAA